jgi:hypothetical protein
VRRGTRALAVLGFVLVAAGVAAGLVLALGSGGGSGPAREEYLAEIEAICSVYERRLEAIPGPDVTIPGSVLESVDRALPLVEGRLTEARAVKPPAGLEVERFFELTERANRRLHELRRAALARDLPRSARALGDYVRTRDAARAESARIGFRC